MRQPNGIGISPGNRPKIFLDQNKISAIDSGIENPSFLNSVNPVAEKTAYTRFSAQNRIATHIRTSTTHPEGYLE